MKKIIKTILIISIAVFGVGFLLVSPTNAQANGLVVEYWTGTEWLPLTGPIFSETNFLPGEDVTRLVRVTNNSGQSQRIATEAINVSDTNRLGDVLNLEIKEGGVTRYNKPLSKIFTAGEEYLSNLANGAQTQYDYIVTFYSGTQDIFQGKTLRFDILIGFQGEEGGLLPGAGGGAGGFLPAGLTIIEGTVTIPEGAIGETSVTITWTTSYSSTSQVIYAAAAETYSFDLTKPNYGYPHAAPVPEDSAKVTFHSVTIIGLTPGTTYYYRTVSHGSLAISREYSFTTKGVAGETIEETLRKMAEEIIPSAPTIEAEKPLVSEEVGLSKEIVPPERGLVSMVAAIGMIMGEISQSAWKMIIVILGLIGLVLVGIREWELARKKKRT